MLRKLLLVFNVYLLKMMFQSTPASDASTLSLPQSAVSDEHAIDDENFSFLSDDSKCQIRA